MANPLDVEPTLERFDLDEHFHTVLKFFVDLAQVEYDATRATQALRTAMQNIPPTFPRVGEMRMVQAAEAIGVKILSREISVRDAIEYAENEGPIAIWTLSATGLARWFIIERGSGQQGLLRPLLPGDPTEWLGADELARLLGAYDADSVLEFHLAQPTRPMAEATTGLDYVSTLDPRADPIGLTAATLHHGSHDHGHGHSHHSSISPVRRIFSFMSFETRDLTIVFLFALGIGVFSLATPIAVMSVVNSIALVNVGQQLIVMCLVLFLALSLAGFFQLMQTITVEYIQRRVFVRVAEDLSFRLPRVDISAFDRRHGPELVNRFFDVLTVQKAAATLLLDGLSILLQITIGLVLLGYYHTLLLGFDLVLITSLIILFVVLGWGGPSTAIRESIAKYGVAGWMEEVARHPLAFKTDGGPQFALERTDLLTREYLEARASHFRVLMRQFGFALILQAAANAGLLAVGGYLVIEGRLTLGELVAAELVVTMVVATFAKLGKQLEAYYDMYAAVDKVGHLLDLPLERSGGVAPKASSRGMHIKVHNVVFSYDGSHHEALLGVSMEIKPGERIALMGPNGSGKSTLVDVIFGLRQPQSGWVELDGHDLREYGLDLLRQQVSMVDRIEVFEGSILSNLRMGRQTITVADIRETLRKVNLLDTIMALPDGIHTQIQPGGAPLSMGQATRLMIARAILGKPRLLILDETLDNMDRSLRNIVAPALLGNSANWTVITVTHSEDVARLCTRVIRMESSNHHVRTASHAKENHHGH